MADPMGEAKLGPLRVNFDRRLKLEFHGSDISTDGGLLPYRGLVDALGLTELGGVVLSETRHGKNIRHLLVGLLRQSVFGRLAGYEDVNDAEHLSQDPVMRAIVDRKGCASWSPHHLPTSRGSNPKAAIRRDHTPD